MKLKKMKNPKRLILFIGLPLAALIAAVVVIVSAVGGGSDPERFQFAAVVRGPIQTTVVSTGTISARNTVEVGTQVSGPIAKIHVDYNDNVKKGQVLAELDTTLLENAVQSAVAAQLKADAQYQLALQDFNNNKLLHDKALISDFDFKTSQVNKDSAYANKLSADAALARARISLDEAVIRAPISGVVIDRAVEQGQTVAASLSAPTLFTIAEDLANVQITAYVAESDIGAIRTGQKTTFTVAAYPDDTFTGTVDIVHLQPQTVQNVVNYVVMVDAANPGLKLKPGMTATVTFITDERRNALLISNSALTFKPSDDQITQYLKDHPEIADNGGSDQGGSNQAAAGPNASPSPRPSLSPQEREARRRQYAQRRNAQGGGDQSGREDLAQGNNGARQRLDGDGNSFNRQVGLERKDGGLAADLAANPNVKLLWGVDEKGSLFAMPVRTGISDGQKTELISNRITEGMTFISGKGERKPAANNNQGRGFGPFFH
ncbi:MAG: efflux RND transporter periplasmic adaptor subunit [Spirochaetales bacterium]|nr:efflux RND transporter periplasmic adaptor subunit [Spirochaetales bacterium]